MKLKIISILCMTIILGAASFVNGQTVMIVNTNNSVSDISRAEAANFFTGNATQWGNGLKAVPVDQKKSTGPGQAFLAKIVKMGESDYKNMWVEKMLSGEAEPPMTKGSDAEVIEFVKSNTGAIGYISESTSPDGVKILKIDGSKNW